MPIEIRELSIKVNVNQDRTIPTPSAGSAAGPNENDSKEAIIKEAVEQMVHILDNKKER
jgi:hypothetical protein